jgi:hypothetical protein
MIDDDKEWFDKAVHTPSVQQKTPGPCSNTIFQKPTYSFHSYPLADRRLSLEPRAQQHHLDAREAPGEA